MITNLHVYLAIAEEALAESERLENLARRSKPDGEPGFIMTFDPERRSFKHSLVAIAFAGMFLEAMFYVVGVGRFGEVVYNKRFDGETYERKLKLFGLLDPKLLDEAKRFRNMRNGLVHEKAVDISELGPVDKPDPETKATEQDEAEVAGCGLVIPGGNTPLFLEMTNEAFDA